MQGIHTFTSRSKNNLLSQCKKVISWICQVSIPNYDDINPTMPQTTFHESWQHFPVTSNWQNKIHSTISKRAYNLCVSCNVSAFSGWESDEFVMKLLKRRKRGQNHFGVHVKGEYVAGCLNSSAEVELLDQWKLMRVTLPNLSGLRFREGITKIEKENWHVASKAKMDDYGGCNDSIDVFGEGTALNILILFSRLCLIVAKKVEDEFREESLLKYALSIMLPLSQFALNQQLWDSPLGTEAAKEEVDVNDWEHFVAPPNVTYKPPVRQKQVKKYTRQSEGSSLTPKVHEESLFVKLVKVPTKVILQEWTGKEYFDDEDKDKKQHRRLNKWSEECSGSAKLAMKKVDYTIRKLRGCLTIHSLQKTSTQVALALLEVAPKNECKNPFLCLHQAAVFASHGSKGGNNDEIFKKPLPANHVCTPSEALSILGRADCLRALYFTNEAMFLCSYVAKVCCLHRDKKNSKLAWTPQWRVIGIYMYTVSLALDATIHSLTQGDARTAALKTWAKSVRKEIVRARCDAVAVNRAVAKKNLQNVRNEGPKDAGDKQVSDEYNGAYNGEEDESDSDYSDDDYYSEDEVVNNAMEGDKRCDLKEENEGTLAGTTADFMDESIEAPKSTVGIDDFIEGTKSGSPIKKESITKSGSPIIHESTKKPGSPIVIDILDDFIMGNCIIIPDSSEGSIDGDSLDASPDNPSGSESDSNVKVERL